MNLEAYFLRKTYWINDFIKGSPIRSQYRDIRSIIEDKERGEKKREQYLENLLTHAVTNTEFYSKFDYKDLCSFPIVNKSILIENYEKIKVNIDKIPFQKGEMSVQVTSGSTGTPFSVPLDTFKKNRRIAELKYFGEKVGFKSHDKLIHLRTWNRWQNKSKYQSFKENIIPFSISQIDQNKLNKLCSIVKKKRVKALRGYASSIDLFAKYAEKNGIKFPKLKIIIAGSEGLLDGTRDLVAKHIGCGIISQYANQENGILGQESILERKSPFYLNHASYIFEIFKLNEDSPAPYGELGRIIITDLFNYAFPIIRYDTGDVGIMAPMSKYSNDYPVLEQIYGRKIDLIYDANEDIVHPMAIAMILKHYPQILQWQFIQNGQSEYLIRLKVKGHNFNTNDIRSQVLELFGQDAKIKLEFTDDIPILASGKRKSVVNNWK